MNLDWRAAIGVALVLGLAFWLASALEDGSSTSQRVVLAPIAPVGRVVHRTVYAGNGTKEIGTVTVTAPATIHWTCSRCAFFSLTSMPSGTSFIAISSTRASGTSAVDPGTYQAVRVISNGDWTVRITAHGSP